MDAEDRWSICVMRDGQIVEQGTWQALRGIPDWVDPKKFLYKLKDEGLIEAFSFHDEDGKWWFLYDSTQDIQLSGECCRQWYEQCRYSNRYVYSWNSENDSFKVLGGGNYDISVHSTIFETWCASGHNISTTATTPDEAVDGWMKKFKEELQDDDSDIDSCPSIFD